MKWEDLTTSELAKAVKTTKGVCVVPMGCLEPHSHHLPLGTDIFESCAVADAAVAIEPAVVFPPYYLTQVQCGRHHPGTIAIRDKVMFDLLENVCQEISRNGFKKLIFLNGHGGNEAFFEYFTWMMTYERQCDFSVFVARHGDYMSDRKTLKYTAMKEFPKDGHGGEKETSLMLAIRPDLVKTRSVPKNGAVRRGRVDHLPCFTAISWYANYPDHYAGDGNYGTAKKGKVLLEELASNVANIILAVKKDTTVGRLTREFHGRTDHAPDKNSNRKQPTK